MNILPEGEELRRAVKWISEMRQEKPGMNTAMLIGEACLKFDLSPADADYLTRLLQNETGENIC